ncbi:MAG: HEAT repeat domain-containing protein [Acidobacteriota bacterium]|nr:HEAT repeat domain-containing protein [Acidobacteriota bacterium]
MAYKVGGTNQAVMRQTVEQREAILKRAASLEDAGELSRLLTAAMRDPSPFVRTEAIEIAAKNQVEAVIPAIERLLKDRNEMVRFTAVECLGSMGTGHVRSIRSLLRDRSFLVRIETLEALALLNDHGALPGMAKLLSDDNPLVRAYAATSIAGVPGVFCVQAIHNAFDKEKDDTARAGFLLALLMLGRNEFFEAFLDLLSSANYRVRCYVANGLGGLPLNQSQLESAIKALSRAKRHAIARADRTSIASVLTELKIEVSGQKHA